MRTGVVKHNDKLDIIAQSLPLNDGSAAYPYAGYIVNVNVKTDGHLDPNDKDICAVIGFGDYIDGDIVLHQLGTSVKLHPLDVFIFDPRRITHLNLRFTGKWGSLVMATDRGLEDWVKDKNGWENKNFKGDLFRWDDVLVSSK